MQLHKATGDPCKGATGTRAQAASALAQQKAQGGAQGGATGGATGEARDANLCF
jgi:hypothetical protein